MNESKAALLSCGESLRLYPGREGFDVVIGVNRAATAHRCDYWSAMDRPLVKQYAGAVLGTPVLWTLQDSGASLVGHGEWSGAVQTYRREHREESDAWAHYSATAGLWLAGSLAKEVHVYGADMRGVDDWDGHRYKTACRNESRWLRERRLWCETVYLLANQGVKVVRNGFA